MNTTNNRTTTTNTAAQLAADALEREAILAALMDEYWPAIRRAILHRHGSPRDEKHAQYLAGRISEKILANIAELIDHRAPAPMDEMHGTVALAIELAIDDYERGR